MNNSCVFEERSAQPTACIRTHAAVQDLPRIFEESYGTIMSHLGRTGVQPSGMPYAAYYNQDMQNLDLEIGFPVSTSITDSGEVKSGELPGGLWATLMNIGPYDSVGPTYETLTKAIAERGSTVAGPAYEFYFDGPETPPEEIRTLVAFPIT